MLGLAWPQLEAITRGGVVSIYGPLGYEPKMLTLAPLHWILRLLRSKQTEVDCHNGRSAPLVLAAEQGFDLAHGT